MTLVEVVAGLALLATLLTSLLLARARHSQQWVTANQRLQAVEMADELLAQWWSEPEKLPREAQDQLDEQAGWMWRTRVVENAAAESIGAEVVRLEVLKQDPESPPLAVVEIVLRLEEEESTP